MRVAFPEPQRLNRAAVFFRYFLGIPAGLLAGIVLVGASTLMAFIAWLIALVAGQLPPSLYLAYVAVIRFMTRYYSYLWMLTPAYPGGLYGDKPGAVAWADERPAVQAPGFGAPGQAYGTPGSAYGNPADSAPQGYGAPGPRDTARRRVTARRRGTALRRGTARPRGTALPRGTTPHGATALPRGTVLPPLATVLPPGTAPRRVQRAAGLPARHVAAPADVWRQEADNHVHRARRRCSWVGYVI